MLLPAPPLRSWAVGILLVGALTDKLDGDVARWRNEVTEWGRIFDPLADKICVAVMSLVLLKLGDMPLWFVAALRGGTSCILTGGMFLKSPGGWSCPRISPGNGPPRSSR